MRISRKIKIITEIPRKQYKDFVFIITVGCFFSSPSLRDSVPYVIIIFVLFCVEINVLSMDFIEVFTLSLIIIVNFYNR